VQQTKLILMALALAPKWTIFPDVLLYVNNTPLCKRLVEPFASGLLPLKKHPSCSPRFADVRISSRVLLSLLLSLVAHSGSNDLDQFNEAKRFASCFRSSLPGRSMFHLTLLKRAKVRLPSENCGVKLTNSKRVLSIYLLYSIP
jgi:hypothetical protein